jgi:hypothetical protein
MLFYWWPVWAVGLIMAVYTFIEGGIMAIVPRHTQVADIIEGRAVLENDPNQVVALENRKILILEPGKRITHEPHLRVAQSKNPGVIFAMVLLLVTFITNVPLRGLWSVIVIGLILLVVLIFAYYELWGRILGYIAALQIHINGGGYLFIALALLLIWLATMIFFDRQIYMIFTPGQLKVRLEIGGGEASFDTMGMQIEKQRDDLFRHWILGLGSGDLIVRTSGANAREFHLPNVLFIGRKLQLIEKMKTERPIVRG